MKTFIFIFCSIISVSFGFSQNQPKLDNYPLGTSEVNVMVFPFGMDDAIKIGTISKSGEINFEFPKELPKISKETEENFMNDIAYTIFKVCDNSNKMISDKENGPSFDAGVLSLSTLENPYAGVVFAVSDEALMPWLEDPAYEEPILGSYFELVYVASDFKYEGECIQTQSSMSDDPETEVAFSFNLNLKTGFNFIEYKIESLEKHEVPSRYKEDEFEKINKPSKVTVTSSQTNLPDTKWIGKYF